MAHPRFFVPDLSTNRLVDLSPEDARHALNVLRLKIGDDVTLFDGRGLEAIGQITECRKAQVEIGIASPQEISRELSGHLQLFVSLPKGDRQKQLVEILVPLGVHSLTPLICQRSVAQPTENAMDRLRRMVIESCKQCGRNQLMSIQPSITLQDLASPNRTATPQACSLRCFAHPYGKAISLLTAFQGQPPKSSTSACVLVGPEGGLTDSEVQHLVGAGWQQVHLGARILRIETAAIAVAATWAAWQEP